MDGIMGCSDIFEIKLESEEGLLHLNLAPFDIKFVVVFCRN